MAQVVRTVGRYEVLREIGRGGMAVVYLARQTDLDRQVALKELAAFHAADPAFAERFLRESRVAGSLSHPNIVTVHDYFEHEGVPYISMEYLPRGSLRPLVRELKLAQIVGVLEGLLSGLTHAAKRGIVHRDLKPENIMITGEGGVKIADFGIAKAYNKAAPGQYLTATGTTVGTPAYMAPEQAMAKNVGPWTDVYSAGVIAYELLVGNVPFHNTETPMAILLQHVNDPVPPPRTVNPDLDRRLSGWIEWLLAKDPDDRPASAEEAWDALDEIVDEILGGRWRRDARLPGMTATIDTPKPLTPAPFHETNEAAEAPEDGFQTFLAGAHRQPETPAEAPVSPPEPPAVPPVAPESPPSPSPSPAATEGELAGAPSAEFLTYAPRGNAHPAAPSEAEEPPAAEAPPAHPPTAPFETRAPSVPEPPPAAPPEPAAPAAPPPEPEQAATPEEEAPVAPAPAELSSFQWPAALQTGVFARVGGRRTLWIAAMVLLLAGVGAGIAVLSGGGGSGPSTAAAAAKDALPAQPPGVGLAASGSSVYASDSNGRLVALAGSDLSRGQRLDDPAKPRYLAVAGDKLYVADDKTLIEFGRTDLAPIAAAHNSIAPVGLDAAGAVAEIQSAGGATGRLCLFRNGALNPCLALRFAPSGVGVASSRDFYVADSAGRRLFHYRLRGSRLVGAGRAIVLRRSPRGPLVSFRDRLYMPVSRGVAVVDARSRHVLRTISFPTTPASISIDRASGKLFAALYASNGIGMVDALGSDKPRVVAKLERPVAVVSSTETNSVYAVSGSARKIIRLDGVTGDQQTTAALGGLAGVPLTPVAARAVNFTTKRRTIEVRLGLTGGSLAASALVKRDLAIKDGTASVELWQPGITSGIGRKQSAKVGVLIQQLPAHLLVTFRAKKGAFTRMSVSLARTGRSVSVTLVGKPKPVHRGGGAHQAPPPPQPKPVAPPPPVAPQPPPPPPPSCPRRRCEPPPPPPPPCGRRCR